ncbi:MAG TPA: purine-nucleoside phosphorylase [Thermoanaerobaculia bacterium]|jgi:purine-nucleoside phosphorylase|nr:purine-nucleoside phosphorylase [Thermoanaerobaculia bacterium]
MTKATSTDINDAVAYIRSKSSLQPDVGVILGSGLGNVVDAVDIETSIPYGDIPGARASTVLGHQGRLILGHTQGTPVAMMQGRVHFYEGYEMQEVMFLSRVLGRLGIRKLIVTNAAGGINTSYVPGDLMIISDHINLMGVNPLRGPNIDDLGLRFPDMSDAYSEDLRAIAHATAKQLGVEVKEGVYLALSGPTYETPAEIRAFRILGADAVGMSTAPEVIAMAHMQIPVLGISCITNMAAGVIKQKLTHQEVMDTTQRVEKQFTELVLALIERLK